MKLAIMQPYFLPYPGYFQLMAAVDEFIVYDNIKYVKSPAGSTATGSAGTGAPRRSRCRLKHASDSLDVRERELAEAFDPGRLLNQFRGAYAKAPQFPEIFPWLEGIMRHSERNLFRFLHHSIRAARELLGIETTLRTSSEITIDHALKGKNKVIALCRAEGADTYINAIGGTELYDKEEFAQQGIELAFLRSRPLEYPQTGPELRAVALHRRHVDVQPLGLGPRTHRGSLRPDLTGGARSSCSDGRNSARCSRRRRSRAGPGCGSSPRRRVP